MVAATFQGRRCEGDAAPPPVLVFGWADLFRLKALGAAFDGKGHESAFIESPITAGLDRREVDENVFPAITLDTSKSFSSVEPFHCSCFFHNSLFLPFLLWCLA